ncbi:hypothetical protein P7F88_01850 [Vibrio hannami]|nr:hypothetical protein [Vibrio hannami]MDG3084899.1 hypothetical protein [Vibrio hannami]
MNIVQSLNLMDFPLIDKDLSLNENFYLESIEHQKREIQHDLAKAVLALLEHLNA